MRRAGVMTVVACLALGGCGGGGGSNDQGNSVRALGVFQETIEQVAPAADTFPSADEAVGESGRTISLSTTLTVPNDLNGDGDLDGGFIGMRNELEQQAVNVEGVRVALFVQGALLANPVLTDFVPLAITLDPAGTGEEEEAPNNVAFVQTLFISTDTLAFLNQNRNLLPPTPYNINVVMEVTATSDSGDGFESNEFTYNLNVVP